MALSEQVLVVIRIEIIFFVSNYCMVHFSPTCETIFPVRLVVLMYVFTSLTFCALVRMDDHKQVFLYIFTVLVSVFELYVGRLNQCKSRNHKDVKCKHSVEQAL